MARTVLITGASSGIGLSTAVFLSASGYHVYGTSREASSLSLEVLEKRFKTDNQKYRFTDKEKLQVTAVKNQVPEKLLANLASHLQKVKFLNVDITRPDSVHRVVADIEKDRSIDVLINNAGLAFYQSVAEANLEEVKRVFEVDFFGHLKMIQAILPGMVSQGKGFILNVTSVAGVVGVPFTAHYCAAKAGMERITESLRNELLPFGIKVSSLLPGDINTAVAANMAMTQGQSSGIQSTNIAGMLDHFPIDESSPFFKTGRQVWDIFIRNHIMAPPPLLVAGKVGKIISNKNPKIHYKVGNFLQSKGVTILQRILPETINMKIVAKLYGL